MIKMGFRLTWNSAVLEAASASWPPLPALRCAPGTGRLGCGQAQSQSLSKSPELMRGCEGTSSPPRRPERVLVPDRILTPRGIIYIPEDIWETQEDGPLRGYFVNLLLYVFTFICVSFVIITNKTFISSDCWHLPTFTLLSGCGKHAHDEGRNPWLSCPAEDDSAWHGPVITSNCVSLPLLPNGNLSMLCPLCITVCSGCYYG